MVELADSLDSGSSVQYGRAGSSPAPRTTVCPKTLVFARVFDACPAVIPGIYCVPKTGRQWVRVCRVFNELQVCFILDAMQKYIIELYDTFITSSVFKPASDSTTFSVKPNAPVKVIVYSPFGNIKFSSLKKAVQNAASGLSPSHPPLFI